MNITNHTVFDGKVPPVCTAGWAGGSVWAFLSDICAEYHLHAGMRAIIARAARTPNFATPSCCLTKSAASSGPKENPHDPRPEISIAPTPAARPTPGKLFSKPQGV